MTTLFFRDWRLFALAVGTLVALGLSALVSIGRQEDPTITNLFATVVTAYPGADPGRVEALVTEPIEEELRTIPEIDTIESTSRTGISVVQVELSSFIGEADIERAWSEIRDALADAALEFPAGAGEPDFDNDRTGAYTAISAITARPGTDVAPGILRRYAEMLQDRLRQVADTKQVDLFGADREEVRVEIDPVRVASVGLTPAAVSAAIAAADAKVRAGQVRGGRSDLLVEIAGEIDGLQRVRDIPLTEGADGRVLRVADVASVVRAVVDPPDSIAYADGDRAVLVAAMMENDRQVDTWTQGVDRAVAAFEATLPAGLEHRQIFQQRAYTADRLSNLAGNMAIGVGLVLIVLVFSLGWRAALVVAAVIPLTALGTIAILQTLGVSIHQMSVTGLIVALGLLVDAAIVMTDEIRKRLAAGQDRPTAVGDAVRRLAMPLLASTVTTVLAFLPMALLPGPAGDFVGSIAIAVIVMLIMSLLLAVTITPALAGWLLPDPTSGRGGGVALRPVVRAFRRSLDLSLRFPGLAVLGALILPVIGFGAFPSLTAQFFPGVDRDQFHVQLRLPGGAAIGETERQAKRAEAIIRAADGVRHVHWVIGESAPSFYYNMTMNQDGVAAFAEALVTTESPAATVAAIPDLQRRLDAAVPGARILVRDLVQGPPVGAPVELRLVGPDLETLRRLGERARGLMAGVSGVTHTRATLAGGDPTLIFSLDEDKVRLAGFDLGTVAAQLDMALEGAVGGSQIEGTEEMPVRVRVGGAARASVDAVRALEVVAADGPALTALGGYAGVPLAALGTAAVIPSESPVTRRNGERVNLVQGYVALGVLPEEALRQVRALLAESPLDLPAGYRLEFGGDADARAETVRNLASTLGLVVTLTLVTIVLTFRSFRLSLVTVAVAGLSMGLSLLALAVFGYPFGIQALIGVIGSIGVSINAAIIILTALQQDPGAAAGDRDSIAGVVAGAGRHIVSTTVTTFGGFLPLILAGGGFWPPFAMAVAGGVLLSTIVSFYFVPPMFALTVGRRRETARPAATATPALRPVAVQ
ncbi:MAG: efflux RND transporter permease subunit [Inquilinaceae bacterium]